MTLSLCLSGAVVLQPWNPFDNVDLPEAIRYLSCSGNESDISQCDIDTEEVEDCGQFEIAGVICQGIQIAKPLITSQTGHSCEQIEFSMAF